MKIGEKMTHLPIYSDPSELELNTRKNKLLASMEERGLDCLVIVDPDNIYWLTNFANYIHERPFILLLQLSGQLTFIIPELERQHATTRSIGNIELDTYYEFPCEEDLAWLGVFQKRISGFKKVGIELNAPQFISNAIKPTIEASELVEEARYVKSDYELGRIVYSCKVATRAMEKLLKMARPGLSLLELHSRITKLMQLQLLSDNPQINPLATNVAAVVQPPNVSHDPHNFTNLMDMDMCQGGPHVSIINGTMNGYGTEVERTFFLGDVPSKAEKPYQVMMEARALCIELCVAGADMHDVDSRVVQLLTKYGYGDNILHRVGHSIGVTGHEGPFLAKGFHHQIQAGMLFTIEPGIYIDGIGGFRHSDTLLVTKNGNEVLTPVKDSLRDMTIPIKTLQFKTSPAFKQKMLKVYNRYLGLNL
jgi:Xaa-Pro dipeptidase